MLTKVIVFQIDSTENIIDTSVGLVNDYLYELLFAKYSILHLDPILCDEVIAIETKKSFCEEELPLTDVTAGLDFNNLTTEQLLNVVLINPEKYLNIKPLKGVRKNLLFTIRGTSMNNINCGDTGAYKNVGGTKKVISCRKK